MDVSWYNSKNIGYINNDSSIGEEYFFLNKTVCAFNGKRRQNERTARQRPGFPFLPSALIRIACPFSSKSLPSTNGNALIPSEERWILLEKQWMDVVSFMLDEANDV